MCPCVLLLCVNLAYANAVCYQTYHIIQQYIIIWSTSAFAALSRRFSIFYPEVNPYSVWWFYEDSARKSIIMELSNAGMMKIIWIINRSAERHYISIVVCCHVLQRKCRDALVWHSCASNLRLLRGVIIFHQINQLTDDVRYIGDEASNPFMNGKNFQVSLKMSYLPRQKDRVRVSVINHFQLFSILIQLKEWMCDSVDAPSNIGMVSTIGWYFGSRQIINY